MLSNTGTVAFVLYGIMLVFAFIGAYLTIKLIQGDIEDKKATLIADLVKWAIFTVGIGTTGYIVTNLFKERDQDITELEYFDNYVDEVKNADGVEARYRLVKYLSIVSPSGEIKKAWQEYLKEVSKEYDEYLALLAKESTDESLQGLPMEERIKAIEDQSKLNAFERPLASIRGAPEKPTIYIQYCDKRKMVPVRALRNLFTENSWNAPGIELVEGGCDNTIRYFHEEDRELANRANTLLENRYVIKKVDLRAPRGQIELWVGDIAP